MPYRPAFPDLSHTGNTPPTTRDCRRAAPSPEEGDVCWALPLGAWPAGVAVGGCSSSVWPHWETWTLLPPSGTGQWEPPRTTYQEAFKLLGFCDVDPAVFLHHLDVLHLVVEPRPSTRAQWSLCRPIQPPPRRAPGLLHMCWSKDPDPRSTPPAPTPAWACLQLSVHPSSRPPGLSEAQTPGSAKASGPRVPHLSSPQPCGDVHPRCCLLSALGTSPSPRPPPCLHVLDAYGKALGLRRPLPD